MQDELFVLKLFKHCLSALSFPPKKILRASCINTLTQILLVTVSPKIDELNQISHIKQTAFHMCFMLLAQM